MGVISGDGTLRLLLQFARAKEAGDPYGFQFEPQDYILQTAGGATPSTQFEWTSDVLADLETVRRPGRKPSVVQRLVRLSHIPELTGIAVCDLRGG